MKTILLTVILTLLFALTSSSDGQGIWTKNPANPVLTGGAPNSWNENILMPCVLFNPDSLRYEMWFSARIRWTPYYFRPYRIGYAVSDNGINWNMHNTPVLDTTSGRWDDLTVEAQSVILDSGIYKMWYTGWNVADDSGGIGYARSINGIDWTKHQSYVMGAGTAFWDEYQPYSPSIMPVNGGYNMWYAAADSNLSEYNIGYAFSVDGINWQRDTVNNPVLEVGSSGCWDDYAVSMPYVHRIDSTYYMWYTGNNTANKKQGGLAYSDDGIHWTKYDDPTTTSAPYAESDPVIMPSSGQWDGSIVEIGNVLVIGDTLHMWYDGRLSPSPPNQQQIGHATLPIDTLLTITNIEQSLSSNLPKVVILKQNYPNPFNPSTKIKYTLPKSEKVKIDIFNLLGQKIETLVNKQMPLGSHEIEFTAKDLPSGVYLYQLQVGEYINTKKMILMK